MQVILIASIDANARQDQQIAGHQINYITADSEAADICCSLGWDRLEVSCDVLLFTCTGVVFTSCNVVSFCPQAGLMADLAQQQSLLPPWTLLEAFEHKGISCLCLAAFAAEGNNAPDAMQLADAANHYLHLLLQQQPQQDRKCSETNNRMRLSSPWVAPLSWKYVYGSASARRFY